MIYTLLLPQKSYAILRFAERSYRLVEIPVSGDSLKQLALDWRKNLTDRFYGDYRQGSRALYEALIRPIETQLKSPLVKHLVFVQDGVLRNIPMAALYDPGQEQFLIENYLVSYSLGLGGKLVGAQPQAPLIVGSSAASPAFPNAIPGVVRETEQVQELLGGTRLLDEAFTPKALAARLELDNYDLLHWASHSRFPGLSDEVELQTGTAVLNLVEFEKLLRGRSAQLKHLTLSACETASGSRGATLGLAGIGLRAGIESVLGSLWFADDRLAA